MEFLSPEEKRAKTFRLFFSYGLGLVAIVSFTIVLSFVLQGIDLLQRGSEVKNGLLFVDSKPVSGRIDVGGDTTKSTEARFVLPEGKYDLKISADGYRDWSKNIDVVGGRVRYHVYPKLFPSDIKTNNKANYNEEPFLYNQSPDRKWLVLSPGRAQPILHKYDLGKPDSVAVQLALPPNILKPAELAQVKFEFVEWSSDSKNVLYKKILADGTFQFVVINIDKIEESINVTENLKIGPEEEVSLFDQKFDKFYLLNKTNGALKYATIKDGIVNQPLLQGVVDFKYYGKDVILYASASQDNPDELLVSIKDKDKSYKLENITKGDLVLLDIAKYDNDWYFVVSSNKEKQASIYQNPFTQTPNPLDDGAIKPQIKLVISNPREVSFSENARFIVAQSLDEINVYDAEITKKYRYKAPLPLPADTPIKWMDGHRFSFISNNRLVVFEFDGKNQTDLVQAEAGFRPYYDRDYEFVYSINKQESQFVLQQSGLVVE